MYFYNSYYICSIVTGVSRVKRKKKKGKCVCVCVREREGERGREDGERKMKIDTKIAYF